MRPNFEKGNGLLPVIIQDYCTQEVLMMAYMNNEAFEKTKQERVVTFFSRSKGRLWTKGETSGNYLSVISMKLDCDNDSLLIKVDPEGPVCHAGTQSCFNDSTSKGFLYRLEQIIRIRLEKEDQSSYTNQLFKKGINKVAQKVGEEAVELIIEAKDNNLDLFKGEAADLLYHLLVLFRMKDLQLEDIETVLLSRHK